jgi:reductive dehalogenase
MAQKNFFSKLYVKKLTAETPPYQVNETYKRFDQRNNLTVGRPSWDEEFTSLSHKSLDVKVKKIQSNKPNYQLKDYSLFLAGGVSVFRMGNSINHSNRGVTSWSTLGNKVPPGIDDWEGTPEEAAKMVKRVARYFGAKLVGITPLNKKYIYSHAYWSDGSHKEIIFADVEHPQETDDQMIIPEKMQWVIMMGIPMDIDMMDYTPSPLGCAETRITYSKMGLIVSGVAEFLRGIGHNAIPSINDLGLNIPMAIDAGFGEQGRNGKLVTPEYGPSLRLCKVITDLPMVLDTPIRFGVTEFCEICKKCADECPASAISHGERTWSRDSISCNQGHYTWHLNNEACRKYWSLGVAANCTSCIRACPFTKHPGLIHELARTFISNIPVIDPLLKNMDDWLGYGKEKDGSRFWDG